MIQQTRDYARRTSKTLGIVLAAVLLATYPSAITYATVSAQPAQSGSTAQDEKAASGQSAGDAKQAPAATGSTGNETAATVSVGSAEPAGTVTADPVDEPAATLTVGQDSTMQQPATGQAIQSGTATAATGSQSPVNPGTEAAATATTDSGSSEKSSTQVTAIQNDSTATAQSGNAAVVNNYAAGDAGTGNASADATIVNVVSSNTGFGGGTHTTFTKDIYGDVQGNLLIDPATLKPLNGTAGTTLANPTQNSLSLVDIENNVNLEAISGNADVIGNYQAGDATTGDAAALANILNIVSSSVGAQNSFLGVVNIHGNLRGDILVPADFIDSLIASNAGGTAITTAAQEGGGSLVSNINIADNVDLSATSGNATVTGNYSAGNATTGDAATSLTVFNLTGQQVVAKNSLLVFVNVMGKWVGMIVKAPNGATAAALGGGVSGAGAYAGGSGDHRQDVNIRNNITANATSGNATVADNRTAGDAATGDAYAGANILNLVHSSFELGDWFGALFINVLGTWLGDFDVERPAGQGSGSPATDSAAPAPQLPPHAVRAVKVYQFAADTPFTPDPAATADTDTTQIELANARPADRTAVSASPASAVLGSATSTPASLPEVLADNDAVSLYALMAGMLLLTAISVTVIRRYRQS